MPKSSSRATPRSPRRNIAKRPGGIACVLLLSLTAVPVQAQTLLETLTAAYQSNPQLQAERARQRNTDEDVAQALGGYRPTVTLSADVGRASDREQSVTQQRVSLFSSDTVTVRSAVNRRRTPQSYVLELQQSLYDGGRTPASVESAEYRVQRGRAVLRSIEASVLGDALTAYYDLYRDQVVLGFYEENVTSLRRQLEATQARYRVKDVTQTDVAQSEARLARGIADRTQAQGNLTSTRSGYLRVVGVPAEKAAPPPPLPPNLPKALNEALDQAESNPDYIAALFAEAESRSNIDVASSDLRPRLSLDVAGLRQDETSEPDYAHNALQATVRLTIPIYEGGISYSRTRGAKHTAEQRRLDLDNSRRKVDDQIKRAWEALTTARSRIVSISEQKRAAEIALDAVSKEVQVGTRSVLDRLNAEQELLDAKVTLIGAQRNEAVGAYNLLIAIGRFGAEEISLPVEIYDPTVNYSDVRGKWIGTGISNGPNKDR